MAEIKRVTLHPLTEEGEIDLSVNLYPKTLVDGVVDRGGNAVDIATQSELNSVASSKQNVLVSGSNIKTINNQSILGSGNINIVSGSVWGSITGTLSNQTDLQNALNEKVDKVSGKGLSTNDFTDSYKSQVESNTIDRHTHSNKSILDNITASYTTAEQTKLSNIESGAQVNTIESIKVNSSTVTPIDKIISLTIPTQASDIHALADSTKYGASISVTIDTTDYKLTTTLKDQNGDTLGTAQVIDLPLESVVVSGSYDDTTKSLILTLTNGNTITIPVSDLISGLVSEDSLATTLQNYASLAGNNTFTGTNTFSEIDIPISADGTTKVGKITQVSNYYLAIKVNNDNFALFDNTSGGYISFTNILPLSNNTRDIGNSSTKWRNIYFSGALKDGNNANYGLTLPDTSGFTADKTLATTDDIPSPVVIDENLLPKTTSTYDIGSSTYKYKDIYASGLIDFGGVVKVNGTNRYNFTPWQIIPYTSQDLGMSTYPFKDIYLNGKLKDGTNEVSVSDISSGLSEANPAVPSGTTPTDLTSIKIGSSYYNVATPITQDLTASVAGTLDSTAWTSLKNSHYFTISSPSMSGLDSNYQFVDIKLSINSNNQIVKLTKNTTNKYSGMFFIEESSSLYELTIYYNGINIVLRCAQVY